MIKNTKNILTNICARAKLYLLGGIVMNLINEIREKQNQLIVMINTTFDEMIDLDLEYIEKKRGFWYDIGIIFRTLPAVFKQNGK